MASGSGRGGPLCPPVFCGRGRGRTQRSAPTYAPIGLALIVVCCVAGCVKQKTTLGPPPPPNPQPKIVSDVNVRVKTVERLAKGYAELAKKLPGPSPAEHRKLMAEVFARLEEIVPMLKGPSSDAEFRQEMQVIGDAQAELATGAGDLSPEPTIDTGLRATRDVLTSIARTDYYDLTELTANMDQLTAKVENLDTARGPVHQVYVGEAVVLSGQIINTMAGALGQRLSQQKSTTAPASRPAPLKTSAAAPSGSR